MIENSRSSFLIPHQEHLYQVWWRNGCNIKKTITLKNIYEYVLMMPHIYVAVRWAKNDWKSTVSVPWFEVITTTNIMILMVKTVSCMVAAIKLTSFLSFGNHSYTHGGYISPTAMLEICLVAKAALRQHFWPAIIMVIPREVLVPPCAIAIN